MNKNYNTLDFVGVPANERAARIAGHFGTPLYLYNTAEVENNFYTLQTAVGDAVNIYYSIKANPNISICAILKNSGAGAEVCSTAELMSVLKAGFAPQQIIFVGPFKKKTDIEFCLKLGIHAIVVESHEEIQLIKVIATDLNCIAKIMLRINPNFSAKNALLKMGGKPSQFGIDETQANDVIKEILSIPSVRLLGIHIYNGTRILNAETIIENTANIFKLAEQLQQEFNYHFTSVDIGGGVGIPYYTKEPTVDITLLQSQLPTIIEKYLAKYPGTQIIMESGRYLVGSAGMMIIQVHGIKESKGEKFIITDGGTNCHMAAVGVGSVIKNNFPMSILGRENQEKTESYHVVGPLCTPNDLLGKSVRLPPVITGDFIAIHQSGAYGPSASPINFLSHGFPAEVLLQGDTAYLIRKADQTEDLLRNQLLIELKGEQQ